MLEEIINFWNNNREAILVISFRILYSLIIIFIGLFISRMLNRLIRKASGSRQQVNSTAGSIIRHIVSYGFFIICAIMVLNIFGVNTTSLLALLGAAGIAIGLALKDTLGNIAAGIILFFLGSYRIGEYIEFSSMGGTVKEVNLFTTILETPDGTYISAPNAIIWSGPLKNYSRNGKRRMEIPVKISFNDSPQAACEALKNLALSESRLLKDPEPQILVQSIQDSSISIILRAWALNENYWDVYWTMMRSVKEKIEEAGLTIPYPVIQVKNTI